MKHECDLSRKMRGGRRPASDVEAVMAYYHGKINNVCTESVHNFVQIGHTTIRLNMAVLEALCPIMNEEKRSVIIHCRPLSTLTGARVVADAVCRGLKILLRSVFFVAHLLFAARRIHQFREKLCKLFEMHAESTNTVRFGRTSRAIMTFLRLHIAKLKSSKWLRPLTSPVISTLCATFYYNPHYFVKSCYRIMETQK